jgi:hypothetical protein
MGMHRALPAHRSEEFGRGRGERPAAEDINVTGKEDETMDLLWIVAVVFFVLWVLGFTALHVTSGFVHILLVLAVVAVVFRLVTGRRTA